MRPELLASLASVVTAAIMGCSAAPSGPMSGATNEDGGAAGPNGGLVDGGGTATGSSDAGGGMPTGVGSQTPLSLMPKTAYTGVDGVHTFRVPVAVYGAKQPTLTASPADAVSIAPAKLVDASQDKGIYFMVTALKAGTVTLTATDSGQTLTGKMNIATYTSAEWDTGSARYNNGVTSGATEQCASCHQGANAVDHSPAIMASASDSQVQTVFLDGQLVSGNPILEVKHKWTVTDAEKTGLVVYLRALLPTGFVH